MGWMAVMISRLTHMKTMKMRWMMLVPLLGLVGACGKQEVSSGAAEEKEERQAEGLVAEVAVGDGKDSPAPVVTVTGAELVKDWHKSMDSPKKLVALADEYEKKYGITRAEAYARIYAEAVEGKTEREERHVGIMFSPGMVKEEPRIAEVMGGLPAGALRSACVAAVSGSGPEQGKVKAIYEAMPESHDRAVVRNVYVTREFLDAGAAGAIAFLDSLGTEHERREALERLAGSVVPAHPALANLPNAPKPPSAAEVEKLIAYGKGRGMEKEVMVLEGKR